MREQDQNSAAAPARPRALRVLLAALVLVVLVTFGAQTPRSGQILEAAGDAIFPETLQPGEVIVVDRSPQQIPAIEGTAAGAEDESTLSASAPVATEEPAATPEATPSSSAEPTAAPVQEAGALPDDTAEELTLEVADPADVPSGDPQTLVAGDGAETVLSVSGTGSVTMGFTRTSTSAAPNLPTYISALCDGDSIYSGAFNTTSAGPVVQEIPFSGDSCTIKVKIAQPSAKWSGSTSAVVVTQDAAVKQDGAAYTGEADWTSQAVSGTSSFPMDLPDGFSGSISLKVTACSSEGGTSDQSRDFACGDLVRKDVGSEAEVTVTDADGTVLAQTDVDITAETHHDMVSLPVEDASGDVTITVESTGGSAMLVHGPGTTAVGTS